MKTEAERKKAIHLACTSLAQSVKALEGKPTVKVTFDLKAVYKAQGV